MYLNPYMTLQASSMNKFKLIVFITIMLLFCFETTTAQTRMDSAILGRTLSTYSHKGNVDSVLALIKRGANPNYVSPFGVNALMYAVEAEHSEVVSILLHNGVDPDIQPRDGFSPLMHASFNSDFESAHYLCKYGAKLDLVDLNGASSLHYAVFAGSYDIVDMHIFYKADINVKAKDGNTPLHFSSYLLDTAIAANMIRNGALIDAENKKGFTPLMIAAQENNLPVLKLLIDKGANADLLNDSSYSALSYAIIFHSDTVFKTLVENTNVDTHKPNSKQNPINLAKYYNNTEQKKELKNKGFKTDWKPLYQSSIYKTGVSFNGKDAYFRQEIGLIDMKHKTAITFGFSSRITRKPVLLEIEQDVLYQVFEKRRYLELNVQKYFVLAHEKNTANHMGIYVGGSLQWANGKYIGLEQKFDKHIYVSPSIGWYGIMENVFLNLGYAFTPYGYYNISPHKIELSIGGILNHKYSPTKHYPSWI